MIKSGSGGINHVLRNFVWEELCLGEFQYGRFSIWEESFSKESKIRVILCGKSSLPGILWEKSSIGKVPKEPLLIVLYSFPDQQIPNPGDEELKLKRINVLKPKKILRYSTVQYIL